MSAPDPAKKLHALVKRLRGKHEPPAPAPRDAEVVVTSDAIIEQFLLSFLVWEASESKAASGLKRLHAAVVDCNELRVCLPDEFARIMGDKYPRSLERASRLRAALNDLYRREHVVTFEPIVGMSKRDARQYLASLEGVPPFVAARVTLLALGGHAFPVDERMLEALGKEEEALPMDLDVESASGWLERQFRAGEATEPYRMIEAWLSEMTPPRRAPAGKAPEGIRVKPARPKPAPGAKRAGKS